MEDEVFKQETFVFFWVSGKNRGWKNRRSDSPKKGCLGLIHGRYSSIDRAYMANFRILFSLRHSISCLISRIEHLFLKPLCDTLRCRIQTPWCKDKTGHPISTQGAAWAVWNDLATWGSRYPSPMFPSTRGELWPSDEIGCTLGFFRRTYLCDSPSVTRYRMGTIY